MSSKVLLILFIFVSLQSKAQQSFDSWKKEVYSNFDNPKALLKNLRKSGYYIKKNEAKRRKDFLILNDSLASREMHFERRTLLDSLIYIGQKSDISKPVLAKYMVPLVSACSATNQGERAAGLLNKLLEPQYKLSKHSRVECLIMLGNLELNFQLPERAVSKYRRALSELDPKLEKSHPLLRSSIYNNMGLSFSKLQKIDSSLFYHQAALTIRKRQKDKFQMGQSLNNIGSLYYGIQFYDSALVYYQQGLEYRSASSRATESSIAESWINIGKTYFRLGNISEAKELLDKSLAYAKHSSNLVIMQRTYKILHELYAAEGNLQSAYEALGNYYLIRDSLFGLAETKDVLHSSYKQELREQALSDSLNQAANRKIFEEKSRKEQVIKYGLALALFGLLAILGLVLRNYRNKVRSNKQISSQKNSLEEKNEEIIGSITYAKRLQNAILPSEQSLTKHLPEQFVLYEPKDIVAGDFYWMHTDGNQIFFAVSDCTGHGVPGALVSIVCSNAMNRATKEFGLKKTGAILDKTTELVLESFSESEEHVNDGMDISLIRMTDNKIQFSGAYNGLWIVSEYPTHLLSQLQAKQFRLTEEEGRSLIEIKANRQPVGYYENRVPFDTVEIQLQKGDQIYLLTDGFGDQFGGSENKKYKTSQLKRFILQIASQPISAQKAALALEFDQWKGAAEQVDDVCLVGIKMGDIKE